MPDGFSLPADAAPLHVDPDGGPLSDRGHPGPDAADPAVAAVGSLPPKPRRADPGDGHRRGTRLHVSRLHAGPRGADQPWHPAPAGATAEQQPTPDRADEWPALLPPGNAGRLLRRRDRDGRQRVPRRSEWGAHTHAMEPRP